MVRVKRPPGLRVLPAPFSVATNQRCRMSSSRSLLTCCPNHANHSELSGVHRSRILLGTSDVAHPIRYAVVNSKRHHRRQPQHLFRCHGPMSPPGQCQTVFSLALATSHADRCLPGLVSLLWTRSPSTWPLTTPQRAVIPCWNCISPVNQTRFQQLEFVLTTDTPTNPCQIHVPDTSNTSPRKHVPQLAQK